MNSAAARRGGEHCRAQLVPKLPQPAQAQAARVCLRVQRVRACVRAPSGTHTHTHTHTTTHPRPRAHTDRPGGSTFRGRPLRVRARGVRASIGGGSVSQCATLTCPLGHTPHAPRREFDAVPRGDNAPATVRACDVAASAERTCSWMPVLELAAHAGPEARHLADLPLTRAALRLPHAHARTHTHARTRTRTHARTKDSHKRERAHTYIESTNTHKYTHARAALSARPCACSRVHQTRTASGARAAAARERCLRCSRARWRRWSRQGGAQPSGPEQVLPVLTPEPPPLVPPGEGVPK